MEKPKQLVIIGAGETANLAYEYFTCDSDWKVNAFAINSRYMTTDHFRGLPVVPLESIENMYPPDTYTLFVALGSGHLNRDRTNLYKNLKMKGYVFASYISSQAFIWRNVEIGENCFILENNILQPFTKVGNNVIMWSGSHLGHQSKIGDNCFITSHVVISGFCEIGKNCFIGVNTSIADHVKIADDNFIAMGMSINKSTQPDRVYAGMKMEISAKEFCGVEE
jgi:sugar O-acyltransferase (sialic acid O-acetyltransferase NeuD family)